MGQVKPGDRIRFVRMDYEQAVALRRRRTTACASCCGAAMPAAASIGAPARATASETIIAALPAEGTRPSVAYRQAGDDLLLEYGDNVLDLALRMRIHLLMEALRERPVAGVRELSPVRSLQIRYDSRLIRQDALIARLLEIEAGLADVATLKVPTRVVHLPLAFEDSATLRGATLPGDRARQRALAAEQRGLHPAHQRPGLARRGAAHRVRRQLSGDGAGRCLPGRALRRADRSAPSAADVQVQPGAHHTAEGTVGIGGVYMCIYGMDSPGGYQLVGRSLPIWNTFMRNPVFQDGKPWLLRFFDQVRFYPVSEAELDVLREDFRHGRASVRIEEEVFDFAAHQRFLAEQATSIAAFQTRQKSAFDAEVALWRSEDVAPPPGPEAAPEAQAELREGERLVSADMCGNVWKVPVEVGQSVSAGDTLVVVEAMKMELSVIAPAAGVVTAIRCVPGKPVNAGDPLVVLAEDAPCTVA